MAFGSSAATVEMSGPTENNDLTEKIIGCAIEVHRNLGPGLLESIYEKALCYEFGAIGLRYKNQVVIPIIYKGTWANIASIYWLKMR